MSATIDGRHWEATLPSAWSDSAGCFAGYVPGLDMLVIGGISGPSLPDTTNASGISILAFGPLEPGTILLGDDANGSGSYSTAVPSQEWSTDGTHGGSLVIESVDSEAGVLRGRFSFDGLAEDGSSEVRVRDGIFVAHLTVAAFDAKAARDAAHRRHFANWSPGRGMDRALVPVASK